MQPQESYLFTYGLSDEEAQKVVTFLIHLFKYAHLRNIAICGRLALLYWAYKHNKRVAQTRLRGVDVVANVIEKVSPQITKEFWVGAIQADYLAFYSQRFGKVNVFTHHYPEDENVVWVDFFGQPVRIVSFEFALAHAIFDCWEIAKHKVALKHFLLVGELLAEEQFDPEVLTRIWEHEYLGPTNGLSYGDAWGAAQHQMLVHSEWLSDYPFRKPLPVKLVAMCWFGLQTLRIQWTNATVWN